MKRCYRAFTKTKCLIYLNYQRELVCNRLSLFFINAEKYWLTVGRKRKVVYFCATQIVSNIVECKLLIVC